MRVATRSAAAASLATLLAVSSGVPASAQGLFWGAVSVSAAPAQSTSTARIVVTVTNTSNQEQTFTAEAMCRLTDLVVTDGAGNVVKPGPANCPASEVTSPLAHLNSNALYGGPPGAERSKRGEPLADWGYALPPGTYTIFAVPSTALWADRSFKAPSGTADSITITLR